MSKNEFLVLRNTSTEYLDKNFIRINNSPVATPVFPLKNPVEACVFVFITKISTASRKKEKSLPLIYETVRIIGKTKWYIKFEFKTVFYNIKFTEKDEWMIAFKIKYGLFE